jgi:hypothetical protein
MTIVEYLSFLHRVRKLAGVRVDNYTGWPHTVSDLAAVMRRISGRSQSGHRRQGAHRNRHFTRK